MFREFDYENKPVVDIVNEMIIDAINKNASDIHFDPTEECLNVRIRIDGVLLEYAKVPNFVKKNLLTRIKIISGMNITETRLPQDGAIKNLTDQIDLDLRVSSLPIVDGEKIVIRILNYSMSSNGLDSLGLSDKNLEKINHLIHIPNGIILVAGATGSGKSTTVYAMLQILNTTARNIITVEDPVEMKIAGINQVQVMSEIGLTFGNTLRSILRQDPDIIMIGEIRDSETARIAVRASITGHLVLSTIHTNNSLTTIERLLDMDVERYLLGSALTGIISQRLVRRLCPKCRQARPTTPYEKNLFEKVLHKNVDTIYTPQGCNECIQGYYGRVALHEVLVINQSVRDAIVNNIHKEELRRLVYNESDVTTLLYDGLEKVFAGLTSIDELLRVIDIEDDFGEDDDELKEALIGKSKEIEAYNNVNNDPSTISEQTPNNTTIDTTLYEQPPTGNTEITMQNQALDFQTSFDQNYNTVIINQESQTPIDSYFTNPLTNEGIATENVTISDNVFGYDSTLQTDNLMNNTLTDPNILNSVDTTFINEATPTNNQAYASTITESDNLETIATPSIDNNQTIQPTTDFIEIQPIQPTQEVLGTDMEAL